jgi:hypothetical protein
MTPEETLALYGQGNAAWNKWAEELLKHKPDIQTADSEKIWEWEQTTKADFRNHRFTERADFAYFIFPGEASFSNCIFEAGAGFYGAYFCGTAGFVRCTFSSFSDFGACIFRSDCNFTHSSFNGVAYFGESLFHKVDFRRATFSERVIFSDCRFNKESNFKMTFFTEAASFENATFHESVTFQASTCHGAILIYSTRFLSVPDFRQAKLSVPCHFQHGQIPTRYELATDVELEKIRALRRIAEAGSDYEHERHFFATEIKILRKTSWKGIENFPVILSSYVYEVLSGFGNSLLKPLYWLAILLMLSFIIHCAVDTNLRETKILQPYATRCLEISPRKSAAILALQKTLIIPGLTASEKRDQANACLFGYLPTPTGMPRQIRIPTSISLFTTFQQIFSILVYFLFGLVIRAKFRIR